MDPIYFLQITNQMIETCKQYITCRFKETIWSQDRSVVRDKLIHCINLKKTYRETYVQVKNQPFLPNAEQFSFSENYVFGKFDTFCKRLNKIITMFDLMEDYTHLFQKRMEGLLLGEGLYCDYSRKFAGTIIRFKKLLDLFQGYLYNLVQFSHL